MVLLTDTSNISFIEHSGQNTKNRYNIKNQTFNSVYNEKSSYFVDAERFNYTIGTVLIANLIKNTHIKSIFSCDVLIIGGGSAGLRSAIEAHDSGVENVLIISQSRKGDPHTVLARGGINAALGTMDPEDNWMIHAADTLREGEFLADYERVEVLCKNAPDAVFLL